MTTIKAGDLGAEHIDSNIKWFVRRLNDPIHVFVQSGRISLVTHTRRQTIVRLNNRDHRLRHDYEVEVS